MGENGFKIVLVEDDEEDYLILNGVLEQAFRNQVSLAWIDRCDEAVENICHSPPDLLLVDYDLTGGCTGFDVVRAVEEKGVRVPSVLLTAHKEETIGAEEVREKFDAYLSKHDLTPQAVKKLLPAVCRKS